MSKFLRLAELLEQAAMSLREADVALANIPANNSPITELEGWQTLSVRARNVLKKQPPDFRNNGDWWTIDTLTSLTWDDFLKIKNCGPTTIHEIILFAMKNGVRIKGSPKI